MPILFPKVDTRIPSPKLDGAMASKNAMLKALLQGQALGIEGANQEANIEQKAQADLARLIKGEELERESQGLIRGQVQADSAKNPKMAISASNRGYSMTPRDTLQHELANENRTSQETERAQKAYKEELGNARDRAAALSEMRAMLNDPSKFNYGQFQTAGARLRDKGALSNEDVARVLPQNLRSDATKLKNYILGTQDSPFTEDDIKGASQFLDTEIAANAKRIEAADAALLSRADTLMPHQTRAGTAGKTLKSLGVGIKQLGKQPPAAGNKFQPDFNAIDAVLKQRGISK